MTATLDEHYREGEEALALHFASLLNAEARAELAAAGADVIQFDEPCFNIYVDKVEHWGITALEKGSPRAWLPNVGPRTHLLWLRHGDGAGLEDAEPGLEPLQTSRCPCSASPASIRCRSSARPSGVDPSVLRALEGKDVRSQAVIDVGTEDVETPDVVADAAFADCSITCPPTVCSPAPTAGWSLVHPSGGFGQAAGARGRRGARARRARRSGSGGHRGSALAARIGAPVFLTWCRELW